MKFQPFNFSQSTIWMNLPSLIISDQKLKIYRKVGWLNRGLRSIQFFKYMTHQTILGDAWEYTTNAVECFGGFLLTVMGWYLKKRVNELQLNLDDVVFAGQRRPLSLPKDPRDEIQQILVDSPV